jgi:hypothetical protein
LVADEELKGVRAQIEQFRSFMSEDNIRDMFSVSDGHRLRVWVLVKVS